MIAQVASNDLRLHLMANGQASMLRLLRSGGKNTQAHMASLCAVR